MAALMLLFTLLSFLVVTRQRTRIVRLEDQVRRLEQGNEQLQRRVRWDNEAIRVRDNYINRRVFESSPMGWRIPITNRERSMN